MDKIMDEIKRIVKDEHRRGYEEGYHNGVVVGKSVVVDKGYTAEKLHDALRLICDSIDNGGMPLCDLVPIFGTGDVYTILQGFSAKEIIDKVEAYKEKKKKEEEEILVGDVLKAIAEIDEDDALEYIVTYIDVDHKHYDCVCPDGAVYQDVDIQAMVKTGKRYKITFTEEKNGAV